MTSSIVDIVIPVYNGARDLRECLDSVLRQTYRNWRAVVVNNCSTDETGAIADGYASRDDRIRVLHCQEFLDQAGNYNRAVASASAGVRYIKLLEADNWMTEDYLERLLEVAENAPRVGLVSCYVLQPGNPIGGCLDYRETVIPGREAGRLFFAGSPIFGSPSAVLFRADALRSQPVSFRTSICYDDLDLYLRIVKSWDFGFVHRMLVFIRDDADSEFGRIGRFNPAAATELLLADIHAKDFLDVKESKSLVDGKRDSYYGTLARALLSGRLNRAYLSFHKSLFAAESRKLELWRMIWPGVAAVFATLLNPGHSIAAIGRRIGARRA